MVKELKQRRIWDKRHFRLLNDGISVWVKTPRKEYEVKYKYDQLGFEVSSIRKKEVSWIFIVLFFLGIGAGLFLIKNSTLESNSQLFTISFIAGSIALLLLLIWFETRKPLTVLEGGEKQVVFLSNSPNKTAVREFIGELHHRMAINLIRKQVRPEDPEVDSNQKIKQLNTLRDQGIIPDALYIEVLQLIKTVKPDNSPIGFYKMKEEE
jgi:hypothetical protein